MKLNHPFKWWKHTEQAKLKMAYTKVCNKLCREMEKHIYIILLLWITLMKKITDKSKMRENLSAERRYEKKHKAKRNASKKKKTPIRQEGKKILEKKIGRKLTKTESVWHIKPIDKWGTNAPSNLKVQSRKENYKEWAKMTHKIRKSKPNKSTVKAKTKKK